MTKYLSDKKWTVDRLKLSGQLWLTGSLPLVIHLLHSLRLSTADLSPVPVRKCQNVGFGPYIIFSMHSRQVTRRLINLREDHAS
jgi:hypothetical protein